ncbi:hypothetical protein P43SY_012128 [Pythium insidiosum]|uniref:Retrotransposon gag domain-containing protein n=1 Tax=Pythium insidiosum TaxID=114742 RepID=A0AAD5L522_PYTIN|nr:hypothetical protein P43SY_012128 [Pythium insidiosum]
MGAARRSWSTLAAAFTKEFCTSRQSEAERYFTLKQRKGETPREHLWRLNAAARKARIPISTPDDLRHHVSRFIKSLADSDIRVALIGRPFRTLEELERALPHTYWAYGDDAGADDDTDFKAHKNVRFDLAGASDDSEELVYQAIAGERRFLSGSVRVVIRAASVAAEADTGSRSARHA